MGPLISDGSFLERRQGSVKFLGCVAAATMMSSSLYVGLQYMLVGSRSSSSSHPGDAGAHSPGPPCLSQARHTPHKAGYYSSGAVGFSGVGMALSVIAGFEMRGQILIMGAFEIPSEFKAWYQLISSQLLLPSSSFEGMSHQTENPPLVGARCLVLFWKGA